MIQLIQLRAGRAVFPNFIYIVYNAKTADAIVIDPGFAIDDILHSVQNRNLNLVGILLTHAHKDHVGKALRLAVHCDVKIAGSAKCLRRVNVPNFLRHVVREDGQFSMGSLAFKAIMTPGHTDCSVCYEAGPYLFTGDTLFMETCGIISNLGGQSHFLFKSCQRLKSLVADETLVFPGHQFRKEIGAPMGDVKKYNIYLQLNDEVQFQSFCERPARGNYPPQVGTVPEMKPKIREIAYLTE